MMIMTSMAPPYHNRVCNSTVVEAVIKLEIQPFHTIIVFLLNHGADADHITLNVGIEQSLKPWSLITY